MTDHTAGPLFSRSEETFRSLLESAPDAMVIVDQDGRIILINSQTEVLFGYRREDLLGQPVEVLVPPRFRDAHISSRSYYSAAPAARPMGSGRDLFGLKKDGTEFPVEISLSPLSTPNGVFISSAIRDVTNRRRSEEALRASEARFAGILDIAQDAIIAIDEANRITLFNQGAEKIFGYSSKEVIGQPLALLLPARITDKHGTHVAGFADSPETARRMGERQEIFGRRKDGSEFPAEASISKLVQQGKTTFTAILRDVSERKRAEEAIQQLNEVLERRVQDRTEALERANEMLQDKVSELELFHDVVVGRELRMMELEKEIQRLRGESSSSLPATDPATSQE